MALLSFAAISGSFAQDNLGESCGCPPVSDRGTPVALSGYADPDGKLTANLLLTCDKIWLLDKKIYVPDGKTLTILPGTVIKANPSTDPAQATALVVSRGGKIYASGTQSCPIVFTASDDDVDGSYPILEKSKWGGLVICGKAKNNLISSNVYSANDQAGIGYIEGFVETNQNAWYGMAPGSEVNDDNSGILTYVSIRHAGAVVAGANEINGLTLGSVGSGTVIDNIEIVSNADDGIEFFGGTVNVKHIAMWWVYDDMFDWDLGWNGNAQFLFGIQAPAALAPGADNGFEADGDDDTKGDQAGFMSHPVIYNATLIGNGKTANTPPDGSGAAAIRAKDRTEGEIYNSLFANWTYGFDVNNKRLSQPPAVGSTDSYTNWNSGSLIVKNNAFVSITNPSNWGAFTYTESSRADNRVPADEAKFTGENNTVQASLSGLDLTYAMTLNAVTDQFDAVPLPQVGNVHTYPSSFFTPVDYRGAFGSLEKSWLSDWSFGKVANATTGLVLCPGDVDNSGAINTDDLLKLLEVFGTSCSK